MRTVIMIAPPTTPPTVPPTIVPTGVVDFDFVVVDEDEGEVEVASDPAAVRLVEGWLEGAAVECIQEVITAGTLENAAGCS
jgi:hypothetical protein